LSLSIICLRAQSNSIQDTLDYIDLCQVEGELEEWKGKVVFLSFWSKSCGPCIRSFKRDNALRNAMIEEGVVLINVSIDNEMHWKRAYERYRPSGMNVRTVSFEAAQDQFEIFNLPVYVTIDKDGSRVAYDRMLYGNIHDFKKWYRAKY